MINDILSNLSPFRSAHFVLSLVLVLLLSFSCYYDNQEDLYPTLSSTNCTNQQVSFSGDILPLMNSSCNQSGCHNSQDRIGQIVLDNYTDLLVPTNNGRLLKSIKHTAGFLPMPDGAAKLDDCTINLVETWINEGALNN